MTNKGNIGLYIHIPFCTKRCAYCDFYSTFLNKDLMREYVNALIVDIKKWGGKINRPISSIYLGGGTPSLLGELLPLLTNTIFESFNVLNDAEITLEINPSGNAEEILAFAKKGKVNRISIGAQSGIDEELILLGRTHTCEDTIKTVNTAREMGFENISLDIMLGLPFSNEDTLKKSIDFITQLNPEHISAYILKIEENTSFYKNKDKLSLPNDDEQAEQYLYMCKLLQANGYRHYEISNFCKNNKFSRHNNIYWSAQEYLGLGASAHSLLDGKRFYYANDIKGYINNPQIVNDGFGGSKQEFIMLSLRLDTGINFYEYKARFNEVIPDLLIEKARTFSKNELLYLTESSISLTDEGMLVSNSIITQLLEAL